MDHKLFLKAMELKNRESDLMNISIQLEQTRPDELHAGNPRTRIRLGEILDSETCDLIITFLHAIVSREIDKISAEFDELGEKTASGGHYGKQ